MTRRESRRKSRKLREYTASAAPLLHTVGRAGASATAGVIGGALTTGLVRSVIPTGPADEGNLARSIANVAAPVIGGCATVVIGAATYEAIGDYTPQRYSLPTLSEDCVEDDE